MSAPIAPSRRHAEPVEVHFETADGINLRGRWHRCEAPRAVVVVVHGFSASRNDSSVVALAESLREEGFDIVTYDARGHGESGGRSGVGSTEHHDVAAVLSTIADDRATAVPVVVVGVSMGSIAVANLLGSTPAASSQVAGAVLVSTPARWRIRPSLVGILSAVVTRTPFGKWFAQRFLGVRIADSWRIGEPVESVISRVRIPVAIVHGRGDRLLEADHAHRLRSSAAGRSRLDIVAEMGHGIDAAGRTAVVDAVHWVLGTVERPHTAP